MTGNSGLGVGVRRVAALCFGLAVLLSAPAGFAANCPRPDALGTSRTLVVDAKAHPLIGTMQMDGEAIGVDSLSVWLTRLEMVQGWVNPWMPTITADSAVPNTFTFSTSVDLTQDVETARGQGQVSDGG